MHFIITTEHKGQRLDKFLKEQFQGLSRAQLQKLIMAGSVTVNGKRVPAHYFLRTGDEVEATVEAPEELRVKANAGVKMVVRNPSQPPLNLRGGDDGNPPLRVRGGRGSYDNVVEVLHEEPDFIVVNKPAGLVVHQGEGHKAPDTLVNGLLARYPEIARVGDDLVRPGIVHRLDADVSGVMVIARTPDMFEHLKRQFKLHEVEKEYAAVVHGKVSPPSGVIEFAIARKGAKMVARPKGATGKSAITEYETLSSDKKISVLRIKTYTGRTHQIRVHLKAKGWPIVGDPLYGTVSARLLLHARKIAFTDLTNRKREFIIEPPFL